ncbi:MAG: prepilin-type N-terminal cleavage/methylation domain-containing protein [Actinomycetota bacterium]|nr:prepilin-type N-terminal cleavage/methylation domain-containing protein [Actinomycetota bacterium]
MFHRFKTVAARRASDEGFTLIELLVVIVIVGILLAIAVPSYLGFRDRANESAAQANVRSAIPAIEAYYADNQAYDGMTPTLLKKNYDSGISSTIAIPSAAGQTYCVQSTVGGKTFHKSGPSANIEKDSC